MLHVDTRDPTPIPAQIERSLRQALQDGLLQPGDPLPTVRQLAVALKINANVLSRAYDELARAGLVEIRSGLGAFVALREHEQAAREDRLRALAALEDRFLTDAAGLGFTLDEVIIHLDSRRTLEG
jgi:GntR family transcriptional regulator